MKTQEVKYFLKDLNTLHRLPTSRKHQSLLLPEYPFDLQLLSASRLYRQSRKFYLSLGGTFQPRLCSTMRALSAQDLFADQIDFSPSFTELLWYKDHVDEVANPQEDMKSLLKFNEISVYHEQNHRILWRLLPPAPTEQKDFCRYLNFAESLVVVLDLAFGDELGKDVSSTFERMRLIYRPGGKDRWSKSSPETYREYLLALLCATYYLLEQTHPDDILPAVNYVLPGQKKLNQSAVRRSFELSELFTNVTNPEWQKRFWKDAQKKLRALQADSEEPPLYLPEDPLDIEEELILAREIFAYYGL